MGQRPFAAIAKTVPCPHGTPGPAWAAKRRVRPPHRKRNARPSALATANTILRRRNSSVFCGNWRCARPTQWDTGLLPPWRKRFPVPTEPPVPPELRSVGCGPRTANVTRDHRLWPQPTPFQGAVTHPLSLVIDGARGAPYEVSAFCWYDKKTIPCLHGTLDSIRPAKRRVRPPHRKTVRKARC